MTDAAGVGGGVEARPPTGFGRTTAGGDVLVFAGGELGGFLDANDVVFEAEIGIDVLFALVMAEDDARAVLEGEDAAGGIEVVGEALEEALAEALEVFEVGFADFAEEEAVEAREALAIVGAHLGEEPVGFTAAAGTTIADRLGAIGEIAETRGGTGGELAGLEDDAGVEEVLDLIGRASGGSGRGGVAIQIGRRTGGAGRSRDTAVHRGTLRYTQSGTSRGLRFGATRVRRSGRGGRRSG